MTTNASLPIELKRAIFPALAADLACQLKKRRINETEVLADFDAWRKARRATRRRR